MNKNKYILVVDDEPLTRESLCEILRIEGYKVNQASDGEEALELIKKNRPEIIVTDLKMPKVDGLTLLRKVKLKYPDIAVVLSTGYGSIETAVKAMKEGAFDYVTKPIIDNEIKIIIQRIYNQKLIIDENIELKQRLALNNRTTFHKIIGQNQGMQRIYNLIESVAPTNATVLIQGESGTGKRLIAHALHHSDDNRKDKPFVEVSCGALPENLLESELFGHVKGSFTSAVKDRKGRFETANGGTIFLDEIDAFSPQLQVKLLKVLQEGDFEMVGDSKTLHVDVRVIAATNQNLKKLIEQKLFREDLYYRLHVIPIDVPPLRERKDDIGLLVEYFLEEFSKKNKNRKFDKISEEAKNILFSYNWPGNVRELENIMERAMILCKGNSIEKEDFPDFLQELQVPTSGLKQGKKLYLKEALKISEVAIIKDALNQCRGNRKKVSELLGINRTTLYNKMKEFKMLDFGE